jgi:hypothetical protein
VGTYGDARRANNPRFEIKKLFLERIF